MNNNDYEIGYRKPPKSTQFKRGKSGNPKGRPKKEREQICDMIEKIFFGDRKARINGQFVTTNYMEMMLMKMSESAINGNVQAAKMMQNMAEKYGFSDGKISVILPYIPSREELAKDFAHELEEYEDNEL